jgi:hypothetical protein
MAEPKHTRAETSLGHNPMLFGRSEPVFIAFDLLFYEGEVFDHYP